jgi:hypothetical protein
MELKNMSDISRWNSTVLRIAPLSIFFLMVLKSMGLENRTFIEVFIHTSI